jgi:hypothetical protein
MIPRLKPHAAFGRWSVASLIALLELSSVEPPYRR